MINDNPSILVVNNITILITSDVIESVLLSSLVYVMLRLLELNKLLSPLPGYEPWSAMDWVFKADDLAKCHRAS